MKINIISNVHGKGILIAVSGNLCVLLLVLPLPLNLAISSDRTSALSVVEALAGSSHLCSNLEFPFLPLGIIR